jgi:hypothetical protein
MFSCLSSSLGGFGVLDDADDVGFLEDQVFLAVHIDFVARPLGEQHDIAFFDIHRDALAVFILGAGADCQYFTLLGFFLSGVRYDA